MVHEADNVLLIGLIFVLNNTFDNIKDCPVLSNHIFPATSIARTCRVYVLSSKLLICIFVCAVVPVTILPDKSTN